MDKKAFACWSGGKDCTLAVFKALKDGWKVCYLVNMLQPDGKKSRSHGLPAELLKLQSQALGIPIIQKKSSWEDYENSFKEILKDLKKRGINTGIFGDIYLQVHRNWVERVCKESGITPLLPLWLKDTETLINEFVNAGFKALIVSINKNFLGKEWLGQEINRDFIEKVKKLGNIDPCGEEGEFHSFVYDGPIFKKRVKFKKGKIYQEGKRLYLELIPLT
ncbi:diphthine--ammonia ligase [Thermodesulfobacterium hydrogeniphilum]|uniref:Dph6-related ATP pyrophosphatase n=1 Tax=Thermodesulfobacterium hydrogeniphilum TaxID=161156 RepID=UPI000570A94B|nr:diphthine--ammonia ligase [Thermodesulfobacterium hydrogeniphilum]